jgi:hypothetical protein
MPVETHILGPDDYFPDIERMNDNAPPEEFREAFGKRVGPYEKAHVVYLLDPKTMQAFTYPTSTAGGHRAVSDLKGDVQRARLLHGPNHFPVVTLSNVHMPTDYGGRQRPAFKVAKFVPIGPAPAQQLAKPKDDMNDEIPFR